MAQHHSGLHDNYATGKKIHSFYAPYS